MSDNSRRVNADGASSRNNLRPFFYILHGKTCITLLALCFIQLVLKNRRQPAIVMGNDVRSKLNYDGGKIGATAKELGKRAVYTKCEPGTNAVSRETVAEQGLEERDECGSCKGRGCCQKRVVANTQEFPEPSKALVMCQSTDLATRVYRDFNKRLKDKRSARARSAVPASTQPPEETAEEYYKRRQGEIILQAQRNNDRGVPWNNRPADQWI